MGRVLRWTTAGESHGRALVAMVEGMIAGVHVTSDDIAGQLARRRLGYGRGARMKFEQDQVTVLAGVRHGITLGGPIAIEVGNTEWPKWETVMAADPVDPAVLAESARNAPLTRPRPGHADYAGMLKYGFDDARPVLERASARETAARVAAGTVARAFLREALGVEVLSHVISIGASAPYDGPPPQFSDLSRIDDSPVRAFDEAAEESMIAEIEAAKKDGDTLGGIVEVVVHGLPVGLGSFTSGDNRLDSQLAGAVMGIQAIKGVEIGDGFETARRRGSVAHDEMYPGADGVMRSTNRAGGLEGGMTNGQPVRGGDEADLHRAAGAGHRRHGHRRRGGRDPSALRRLRGARCGCRRRDHGGAGPGTGGLGEVRRRFADRDAGQHRRLPAGGVAARTVRRAGPGNQPVAAGTGVGLMAPKAVLVGMPGSGKSTIGRRLAKAVQLPLLDTDAKIVETTGRSIAELFVDGEQAFRRIEEQVVRTALAEHDGILSLGGGAITSEGVREALTGHTVIYLEISAAEGIRRTTGGTVRPLLAGDDPAKRYRELMAARVPLYRGVATMRINTNRHNPGAVVRSIVSRLENPDAPDPQRRRRRPSWRRGPSSLTPAPTTEAPPSPATVAARNLKANRD